MKRPFFLSAAALLTALLAAPCVSAWDMPGGFDLSEVAKSPLLPEVNSPCALVVIGGFPPQPNIDPDCIPTPSPSPEEPESAPSNATGDS